MLISHAEKSFTFTRKLDQEYKHSGVYSATMMGFIHPFMSADNGLQDALLQNTQLYRVIQNGVAQVYLSTDETLENKVQMFICPSLSFHSSTAFSSCNTDILIFSFHYSRLLTCINEILIK